jgi:hypothetical protein
MEKSIEEKQKDKVSASVGISFFCGVVFGKIMNIDAIATIIEQSTNVTIMTTEQMKMSIDVVISIMLVAFYFITTRYGNKLYDEIKTDTQL